MQSCWFLLFTCLAFTGTLADKYVNVTISDGSPLYGRLMSENIGEFLGIPFGEPPTGSLRFMQPVAKKPWTERLDCTEYPPSCMQKGMAKISEDCLYLNIWVPKFGESKVSLPVMAFIYGGSFQVGSASQYNGSILASRNDVIVLSMNYRVASFGFLAYGSKLKGNMGLWDQSLALRWVKKNIKNFGGDPDQVTIFGESAGAASVGFQVLSEKSAGLFRAAISESGVPNAPWAVLPEQTARATSGSLIETLGCKFLMESRMLKCLQDLDASTILKANVPPNTFFLPVLDNDFIPDEPLNLLRSGRFNKVPLLTGHNSEEAWAFIVPAWPKIFLYSRNLTRSEFITTDAMWVEGMTAIGAQTFSNSKRKQAILHEYSRWTEPVSPRTRQDSLVSAVSDEMFVCPMIQFANLTSQFTPTYIYKFSGLSHMLHLLPDWMGSLHTADLEYIFGNPFVKPQLYSSQEIELSKVFQEAFTNFAKTGGNPSFGTQKWSSYNEKTQEFMNFASYSLTGLNQWQPVRRCEFWNGYLEEILE